MSRLLSFFLPGAIPYLACLLVLHIPAGEEWIPGLESFFPGAAFFAGLLIAWRFNRSRILFALLAIAAAEQALVRLGPAQPGGGAPARLVYDAVALLLPLNLAAFSVLRERGLFTGHGLWRAAALLLQCAAVATAWRNPGSPLAAAGKSPWLSSALCARIPFSPAAAVALGAACALAGVRYFFARDPLQAGLFWALICSASAVAAPPGPAVPLYLGTAALILAVSMLETSFRLAFRDELTGLPGRRALNEACARLSGRYAVAMLDVDHFKRINDRYGHDVGDQVLRMIAARLARVAGGGRSFRYGGEEFAVLFPGTTRKEAARHTDEVRRLVESCRFVVRGRGRPRTRPQTPRPSRRPPRKLAVTVSAGVAERTARRPTPQKVLRAADRALYRAKAAGRNRVCS